MASTTYDFPLVVKRTEDFSNREKSALVALANATAGKLVVCTATEAGPASTTLTNTTLRVNGLKAGKLYKVEFAATAINATAANGFRAGLSLTGTQTTAAFSGQLDSSATGGTVVQTTGGFGNGTFAIMTAASFTTAVTIAGSGIVIPQNDGDLVLQIASGASTTIPTLQLGSYLQVSPLNQSRSQ